jgi:predicted GNAT superfamily acetyltransferase
MTGDLFAEADEAAERAAKGAGVVIRELASLEELTAAIGIFDSIWVPEAGNSSIRLDLLRALTKSGNYATGAYDVTSGSLLGACVGFFGPPAHAELHSHIAGVVAAGLGRSVGLALKVHQRAWCLRRDVRVIAWTYDPLIRRNAYFNLVKLGARPVEYLPNFYGAMADAINGGTETDRMLLHWDLRSRLVADACAGKVRPASHEAELARGAVVALSLGADGWPVVGDGAGGVDRPGPHASGTGSVTASRTGSETGPVTASGTVLVGVPADIEARRVTDPARAAAWRMALRDALAPLMASGARVTGFDRDGWYVVSAGAE